jgi:hypothetical protein
MKHLHHWDSKTENTNRPCSKSSNILELLEIYIENILGNNEDSATC